MILLTICLVALIAFFYYVLAGYNDSGHNPARSDDPYIRESFLRAISEPGLEDKDYKAKKTNLIQLAGTGEYYYRGEAYESVEKGDEVLLEWDTGNQYDSEALAVNTKDGLLLGYIPANRRAFKDFYLMCPDEPLVLVNKKWTEDPDFDKIKIKVWFNYRPDEIEKIKKRNQAK